MMGMAALKTHPGVRLETKQISVNFNTLYYSKADCRDLVMSDS
jgi:hypothetical protein